MFKQLIAFQGKSWQLLTAILLISLSSTSQTLDTSRVRQGVFANPGYDYIGLGMSRTLRPPQDTFPQAARDSGAISVKSGVLYRWNGRANVPYGKGKVLNDSTVIIGTDTLIIRGTGGGGAPSGPAGGDLTSTYPNPSIANNAITTSKINNAAVTIAKINASGTADGTTTLHGDGTWSAIQSQHSVSGNGTSGSPFQLINDASTPGSNKVYGTNSSGTKGYQSTAVLNLTSPTDGQILVYQSGEWVNVDNNPVIPEAQTSFKVGSGGMASGDSVYTDSTLIGKRIKVYREGERMYVDTVYGIESDTSTGTITFHPYVLSGEKIIIEAGNYSTNTPIATLEDLDFPTATNLTHTSTTWSATNGTTIYAGYGLCNKKLASGTDGYIRAKYTSSDGDAALIAFNTSNTNQPYADNPTSPSVYYYEACGFLASGVLYYFDNGGGATSTGYTLSVGDYWRIERTGSTLKLQTSPDGTTWTDRHTFTFSSTADLYINCNIDANTGSHKLYEPKGYNLQ